MWEYKYLRKMDFRMIPILLMLMVISLFVISSTTSIGDQTVFFTPEVQKQLKAFLLGGAFYLFFAGFDYSKLRKYAWFLYAIMVLLLLGLFFTGPIQNVHRWYKIPFVGMGFQPSEYAKLVVVIALSAFLELHHQSLKMGKRAARALTIVAIPFILIVKQPDLGTALVLFPVTLALFYLGSVHKRVLQFLGFLGLSALTLVTLMFLGVLSHEGLKDVGTYFIKEYQYERLNPNTYHQKAAQTAIALGGWVGSGWKESEFTGGGWLPAAYTDSVFAAYAEEYGLIGVFFLLLLFFGLIYFSFQVTAVARDRFGSLLSAGITVYLAMHMLINIGMMCGFLPITGVPLVMVTYGGSSVLSTMSALGILQSIYSRRFMI